MYSFASFSVEEIIPLIQNTTYGKKVRVDLNGFKVNIASQRLFLFAQNQACVCCGVVGNRFILEHHLHPNAQKHNGREEPPHLNLYANWKPEDDENLNRPSQRILMTKDHIQPVSKGGRNIISNYQTMCIICNNIKGGLDISLDLLKEARAMFDSVENKKEAYKEVESFLKLRRNVVNEFLKAEEQIYNLERTIKERVSEKSNLERIITDRIYEIHCYFLGDNISYNWSEEIFVNELLGEVRGFDIISEKAYENSSFLVLLKDGTVIDIFHSIPISWIHDSFKSQVKEILGLVKK